MAKTDGENLIFGKVDGEFVQLGTPLSPPSAPVFYIIGPEGDLHGPLNLEGCKKHLPHLAADELRYKVVERLSAPA